jgi:uncharacterized protein YuzE
MKSTYDDEADALYLYLRDGIRVARSVVVDADRNVDLGPDGRAVGIEVLGASHGVRLLDLVERFGLQAYVPHLRHAEATRYEAVEFA